MSEVMQVSILGSSVTLLVAIGGWIFAYLMQREAKRFARQERKIKKLEEEVRARIALEKAACAWLAELTSRTADAVKLDLRRKTQERSGMRPKMSESDLTNVAAL